MIADVTPGSMVRITVKKTPPSEAAAKTLSRVFAKDPANRKARAHRKQLLKSAMVRTRRGGRISMVRSKAPRLFQPVQGDTCNVRATCDVIKDLGSVERLLDIAPVT